MHHTHAIIHIFICAVLSEQPFYKSVNDKNRTRIGWLLPNKTHGFVITKMQYLEVITNMRYLNVLLT